MGTHCMENSRILQIYLPGLRALDRSNFANYYVDTTRTTTDNNSLYIITILFNEGIDNRDYIHRRDVCITLNNYRLLQDN